VRRSLPALALLLAAAGCGGPRAHVRLTAAPEDALWPAPLTIRASGLPAHASATLRVASVDAARTRYVSTATVHADAAGDVELRGDDALRLLWTLEPPSAPRAYAFGQPSGGARIRLTLVVHGRTRATATVRRLLLGPGVTRRRLTVRRDGIDGELFLPARAASPRPALLLLGGSEGGLERTAEAALLASKGYPALALAYFDAPGLPPNLHRIPLSYFARALRRLARQPGVDPARLVVDGVSRGSEAAQLVAIHYPALVGGLAAEVPSSSSACGIRPWNGRLGPGGGCIGAAWTFRGKVVPYDRVGPNPAHPFPDERIDGPILLTCGEDDLLWPSCPMAHAIASRLRAHGFTHPVTLLDFPNGGHGVGGLPNLPFRFPPVLGGSLYANDPAKARVWRARLAFLRRLG
jgi:dienelactone hydrolase